MDLHREVPWNLNEVLSWEEERVVQGDWKVAYAGKRYQLDRQHEALSLVRRKVDRAYAEERTGVAGVSGQAPHGELSRKEP